MGRLIWTYTVCKCVSEFAWSPNLPDFTLSNTWYFATFMHMHKAFKRIYWTFPTWLDV